MVKKTSKKSPSPVIAETKKSKPAKPKLQKKPSTKTKAKVKAKPNRSVVSQRFITNVPSSSTARSLSKDERNWAMYCHLAAFSGFIIPLGFILGPLVVWLVKRDEFAAVEKHGKEALNFQISMTIYFIISVLLSFVIIGFVFIVALVIMELVFVVMASLKAKEGGFYQYPVTIHFIK